MSVWDDLRAAIEERVRDVAPAPVRRGLVVAANPLVVTVGDLRLEEGDPDVEVDEALKTARPSVGNHVRVYEDEHGDYLLAGRIVNG